MLAETSYQDLPPAWNTLDIGTFSSSMSLWDYQRKAVKQGVKVLFKYYEELLDYNPTETERANDDRRRRLARWYADNGLKDVDIERPAGSRLRALLNDYYPGDGRIPFESVCNRACFWMATGSGKTLVIVKLIEALWVLSRSGEIPANDILLLSSRDDLLSQLGRAVNEFNAAHSDLHIRLVELKQYAEVKRSASSLFRDREITVFTYRSDNLSDEQKERVVDFRNYDNHGRWYILLDEAHKGDREDSKRQHIYSILSRNGFLFSFSATFTDARDRATTAWNYNLAKFIGEGYGKHIGILKQELRAFRDDEDYSGDEKAKIVLKSLIMLTYASEAAEAVRGVVPGAYHRPLLLTLVNSVSVQDADLELFFRELERVCKGDVPAEVWEAATTELWAELKQSPAFMFDTGRVQMDADRFHAIGPSQVLRAVFNADSPGEIEVLLRPSNRKELALQAKSADSPFALLKIGDISAWLKDKLVGYEVREGYADEGFFERLNEDDSDINILMGSRSFYEGWDSNRPNVINFINIGMGPDACKFILQAVGRGVRIEPIRHERKRLSNLPDGGKVSTDTVARIGSLVRPLESLFIFGTNRGALETVLSELDRQRDAREYVQLSLFKNVEAEGRDLLVPVYLTSSTPLAESKEAAHFVLCEDELKRLRAYAALLGDDRVLMAKHGADPRMVRLLRRALADPDAHFSMCDQRRYGRSDVLIRRALDYFSVCPQKVERLTPLADHIVHFERIAVAQPIAQELKQSVVRVADFPKREVRIRQLKLDFEAGHLDLDEYTKRVVATPSAKEETVTYEVGQTVSVRHIANHYYLPVLVAENARPDVIQHAIRTPSEAEFIRALDRYASQPDSAFGQLDWWMFSKLDESLDRVYIPYYDGSTNAVREFRPDFVFWLRKGSDYAIVFVDPKGTAQSEYQRKLDGYHRLFELPDGGPRTFEHAGSSVRVVTYLYSASADAVGEQYRRYWITHPSRIPAALLG